MHAEDALLREVLQVGGAKSFWPKPLASVRRKKSRRSATASCEAEGPRARSASTHASSVRSVCIAVDPLPTGARTKEKIDLSEE